MRVEVESTESRLEALGLELDVVGGRSAYLCLSGYEVVLAEIYKDSYRTGDLTLCPSSSP